jgi:sterol O-acyltransferase
VGAFGELTGYADRFSYAEWWSSTTFSEFARRWNKPVGDWLRAVRGVCDENNRKKTRARYTLPPHTHHHNPHTFPPQSIYDALGQGVCGLFCVFAFSIALHEVLLWAALGPGWRTPWLAIMSSIQLPLFPLLRKSGLKATRAGNLFFWFGLSAGMAINAALYARDARNAEAAAAL